MMNSIRPDPVIEAYKRDVDRTLLRQNLMRSLEERVDQLQSYANLIEEVRVTGGHAERDGD